MAKYRVGMDFRGADAREYGTNHRLFTVKTMLTVANYDDMADAGMVEQDRDVLGKLLALPNVLSLTVIDDQSLIINYREPLTGRDVDPEVVMILMEHQKRLDEAEPDEDPIEPGSDEPMSDSVSMMYRIFRGIRGGHLN